MASAFKAAGVLGIFPVLAHFSPQARCGQRHRYRILVYVKPDICDRLRHDPSPMHEARYRTIRHNPRSLHTVDGSPISGEHLV